MKPPVHVWEPDALLLELDGAYPKKSNERGHFNEQENPGQIDSVYFGRRATFARRNSPTVTE